MRQKQTYSVKSKKLCSTDPINRQFSTFSDIFRQKQTFSDKKTDVFRPPFFWKENVSVTELPRSSKTVCLVREQQQDPLEQQHNTNKLRINRHTPYLRVNLCYVLGIRAYCTTCTCTLISLKSEQK